MRIDAVGGSASDEQNGEVDAADREHTEAEQGPDAAVEVLELCQGIEEHPAHGERDDHDAGRGRAISEKPIRSRLARRLERVANHRAEQHEGVSRPEEPGHERRRVTQRHGGHVRGEPEVRVQHGLHHFERVFGREVVGHDGRGNS